MMGTRSSVGVSLPQQQQMLRDASGEDEEGVRFEIQNPNRLHNVVSSFDNAEITGRSVHPRQHTRPGLVKHKPACNH
jgi:hypothetical protein